MSRAGPFCSAALRVLLVACFAALAGFGAVQAQGLEPIPTMGPGLGDESTRIPSGTALPQLTKDGLKMVAPGADCQLCKVIQVLAAAAERFTWKVASLLLGPFRTLFNSVLFAWIMWNLGKLVVGNIPQPADIAGRLLLGVVLAAGLHSLSLWWDYIYVITRDVLMAIAMMIINAVDNAPIPKNAATFSPFAQIYGVIENAVLNVITAAWHQAIAPPSKPPSGSIWSYIGLTKLGDVAQTVVRFVWGLFLLIPYAFVGLLFAAYVVEGIFKFLAVTALAPVWLAAAFLQRTRGFTEAAIRLYLSGGLTIVFAAVAMGFTLAVTHQFTKDLAAEIKDGVPIFMAYGYWAMLLLGFISVLLHLKAATLAANISGANDGAGPAAAVVAAAKIGAVAAAGATLWAVGARAAATKLGGAAIGRLGPGGLAMVTGARGAGAAVGAAGAAVSSLTARMRAARGQN